MNKLTEEKLELAFWCSNINSDIGHEFCATSQKL